jgi:hypothetical protein
MQKKTEDMMNRRIKLIQILCAGLTAVLFSSCSTSSLYNIWRDSSYTALPIDRILVVTVKRNSAYRRYWEDGLVDEFEQRGLNATPAYSVFGDSIPPVNALLDSVRSYNFAYILIVNRVQEKTKEHYQRGHSGIHPSHEHGELRKDYQNSYEQEKQQAPFPVDPIDARIPIKQNQPQPPPTQRIVPDKPVKVVRHEIKLYATPGTGKLIWIGTGEVIDPSSSQDVNDEIIGLIGPELEAEGFIPAKQDHSK